MNVIYGSSQIFKRFQMSADVKSKIQEKKLNYFSSDKCLNHLSNLQYKIKVTKPAQNFFFRNTLHLVISRGAFANIHYRQTVLKLKIFILNLCHIEKCS